jgi:glycosyltransferase involved in cell wall biosynthesis
MPAEGIAAFLATIDVLAVPVYDDAIAAPLIAALRAGKSVIVPDPSGAAELIEYGRHGLMFAAGSAYHFANAIGLVSQSWSQRQVLLADGGPAVARTDPAAVARALAAVYGGFAPDRRVAPREPSHG